MKYYAAIKRNDVLICAPTWANIRNTVFSERKNIKKTIYYSFIHIYEISGIGKSAEPENGTVAI